MERKPQNITLTYFDGPGRAELTRLVLRAGGVEFTDTRHSFESFAIVKANKSSFVWTQGFGSLPMLQHGDFYISQSAAIAMYAQGLALRGDELTQKQRAVDALFLGGWQDMQDEMYKCLFGSEESKAQGVKDLPAAVQRYMGPLNKRLPESGFVHGRDIPSVADLSVYNLVTSPFPGLRTLKQDLSAFPNVLSTVEACENFLAGEIVLYYFNMTGRVEPARVALRVGGVKFRDERSGTEGSTFNFGEAKKDKNSFIWEHGFGSVPMLQHGDFWLPQAQAIALYCQDQALRGNELTNQQRSIDYMFMATWEDVCKLIVKCKFRGTEEEKAENTKNFPKNVHRFIVGLDNMIPQGEWVHQRDIPSLADIACFCIANDFLEPMGYDWHEHNVLMFAQQVDMVRKLPGSTV